MLDQFTYGQILLYGGVVLFIVGAIALVVGTVIYASKRKRLKETLIDKYGF